MVLVTGYRLVRLLSTGNLEKTMKVPPANCTVDNTRLQRKRTTKEHLEKRSGERNVASGLQVQLKEDGDGSTRQRQVVRGFSLAPRLSSVDGTITSSLQPSGTHSQHC